MEFSKVMHAVLCMQLIKLSLDIKILQETYKQITHFYSCVKKLMLLQ